MGLRRGGAAGPRRRSSSARRSSTGAARLGFAGGARVDGVKGWGRGEPIEGPAGIMGGRAVGDADVIPGEKLGFCWRTGGRRWRRQAGPDGQ